MQEQQLDTLSSAIAWYNGCVNIPFDGHDFQENVARHLHAKMWLSWLNKMHIPHTFNEESLLPLNQRPTFTPAIIVPKFSVEFLDDSTRLLDTTEVPLFFYFDTMSCAHDISGPEEISPNGYAVLENPSLPYRLEGMSWDSTELEGFSGTLKIPQYKDQYFSFPSDVNYADKYFLAGVELGRTPWRELFRRNLYGSLFLVNGFDLGQKQEWEGGSSIRFEPGVDQANEVIIAFYKKYKNSIHYSIVESNCSSNY